MKTNNEFKKYKKEITINGHLVEIEVRITVDEEEYAEDFNLKVNSQVERGDIFAAVISVEAEALGIVGFDSLGQCLLKPNNMFNSKPFNDGVNSYLKDYEMEANAVQDLTKKVEEQYAILTASAKDFERFSK